jgi:hypothetical protein
MSGAHNQSDSPELNALLAITLARLHIEADLSDRQKLCQFLENVSSETHTPAAKIVHAFITRVQVMNRQPDPPKKLIRELLA